MNFILNCEFRGKQEFPFYYITSWVRKVVKFTGLISQSARFGGANPSPTTNVT